MKADDPRVTALAAAIVAFVDGLVVAPKETPPTTAAIDELVPMTAEALAARNLEHRALVRLAETGELRTVRIGRRRYTRTSWLVELAGKLPPTSITTRSTSAAPKSEDLWTTARKFAERRATRVGRQAGH